LPSYVCNVSGLNFGRYGIESYSTGKDTSFVLCSAHPIELGVLSELACL